MKLIHDTRIFVASNVYCRRDRRQLIIGKNNRCYVINKSRETRINVSEHAAATVAQPAVRSGGETFLSEITRMT